MRTRAQVLADGYARLHGERVPGPEPRTRDDHEQRLQVLACVVADADADWHREMQLRRQFREAADRIGLAAGKRTWLLNAAVWAKRSNAPPTMADLWVDAVASPSCLARPRPQDFDPDPRVRRRRTAVPPFVKADPRSIPNMLHALRAASLPARVSRLGDPPHDCGQIQIEMPIKGRSRFAAIAERDWRGRMTWRWVWDGHDSDTGARCVATPTRAWSRSSVAGAPTCKRTCSATQAAPTRRDARLRVLPRSTRAAPALFQPPGSPRRRRASGKA